jgi:hypothetical protein
LHNFNRDFPFDLLPTTSVGLFRDSLPALQICKDFFGSPSVFLWHTGYSYVFLGSNAHFLPDAKTPPRWFPVLPCILTRSAFILTSPFRSQPSNPFQNGPEQLSRDCHFRHLEDYLPGNGLWPICLVRREF